MAAVLALLAAGCGSSRTPSAHESGGAQNRIERAFVRLLAERHPGFTGSSRCPSKRDALDMSHPPCLAEIHKGKKYVEVWATPSHGPPITFRDVHTNSWTRRWSKYARPPQGISPGLISVNGAGSYDWRWLLLGVDYECRQKHRHSCSAGALDGQWGGYPLFFTFRCNVDGKLITCRNTLGDAVRWLPHGRAT